MRTRALTAAAALATITFAAGCGGGSSSGTPAASTPPTTAVSTPPTTAATTPAATATAPTDVASATKAVKKAYLAVFNPKSTTAQKEAALEDGSTLGPTLKFAVKLAAKTGLSLKAKIDKVAFTSSAAATVTYDLVGTPLKGSTGNAVLVNGKWVVSKVTFCGLLALGAAGKTVPGC